MRFVPIIRCTASRRYFGAILKVRITYNEHIASYFYYTLNKHIASHLEW